MDFNPSNNNLTMNIKKHTQDCDKNNNNSHTQKKLHLGEHYRNN